MLELQKATTTLGEQRFEFSLQLKQNETLVIVGESGAGKSTLLNMICGLVEVESGDVLWNGKSLLPLAVQERPATMLFQKHNLFEHLSVRDNIGLGLDPGLKLGNDPEIDATSGWPAVDVALQQMGLEGYGERMPTQLSGGEQQRVALARALIMNRPILLLDEPFSALDSITRRDVLELTKKLCREKQLCAVVVTHNPEDAEVLGARLIRVHDQQTK